MKIEFYQTIAQIIPVLLLAITAQSVFSNNKIRYSGNERRLRRNHLFSLLITYSLLITTEILALLNMYFNIEITYSLLLTFISIFLACTYILFEQILMLYGKDKYVWVVLADLITFGTLFSMLCIIIYQGKGDYVWLLVIFAIIIMFHRFVNVFIGLKEKYRQ
jgi:hypothetical protein